MRAAILATALLCAGPAAAQGQLLANELPLGAPPFSLALEAALTALNTCRANGYQVGVAVVDSTGGLRVVLGADGAEAADPNGSRRAATLAVAQKASGAEIIARIKTDKVLADKIAANKEWNVHQGALLIKSGDKIMGAIAVEGHPHSDRMDVACAQAGIDKIKSRLK